MDSIREQLLDLDGGLDQIELDADRLEQAVADEDDGPLLAAVAVQTATLPAQAPDPVDAAAAADDDAVAARWIAIAAGLDDPSLDEGIDARLADEDTAASTIDGLIRAGADWYHPALVERLDDEQTRFGAAWLLARTAGEELMEAVADIEDLSAVVEILRAAALAGGAEWFDDLVEWRQHLHEELEDRDRHRLDGAIACADPGRYARLLLAGDIDDGWLVDDRAVADFLTAHGANRWLAPLAVFRHVYDTDAFELAAIWAIVAAWTEPFEEFDDDRLDPATAAEWIEQAPERCSLALAMTDDDAFAELLVEAALHETLVRRGVQPPALTGLPLSGHPPQPEQLEERMQPLVDLSMDEPPPRLRLVRTLADLGRMARNGLVDADVARGWMDQLSSSCDAAKLLARTFVENRPVGRIGDWGCRGIEVLAWHLEAPTVDGVVDTAAGWFTGPVERAQMWRAGFEAFGLVESRELVVGSW